MGRDSRFLRPTQVMTRDSHGEADGVDGVDALTETLGASVTILPRALSTPRVGTSAAERFADTCTAALCRQICMVKQVHGWR